MTRTDVLDAAERIRPFVHRTPVMTSETLNRLSGKELFFKCELFQKTGSFKFRGAMNAVRQLPPGTVGVVTHSSGNHGQALALAARMANLPATVVMPSVASEVKKAAIRGYGATIVECGPTLADREAVVKEIVARTGAAMVPPFDHPHIIAGQGTAALELLEEQPGLDALIAPIGGGGLISGFCLAAMGTPTKVYGAEPLGASAAAQSKAANDRVRLASPTSIADGLLANYLGELTWPVVRERVVAVHTVTEDEIRAAMRLVWERMKLVVEASAAVGVAVALSPAFRDVQARKVGIVLCGGNLNLDKLPW